MSEEVIVGTLKDRETQKPFLPRTDASLVAGLEDLSTIRSGAALGATAYQKPVAGIPESDLAAAVAAKLNEAEIFWATYGTTTAAEIDAAVAAGKQLFCVDGGFIHTYAGKDSNYHYFFAVVVNITYRRIQLQISTNGWARHNLGVERTADKVSTLTGNESDTNKYPNTKAVADYVTGIAANKQHRYSVAPEQIAYPKEGDISEVAPVFTQISPTYTDTSEGGSMWATTYYRTYDLTSFSTTKRIKATDTGSGIEGHGFHSYVNADNETVLISDDPYTVILPIGVKSVKMFAEGGIGDNAVASADIYEETTPTVIKEYINGEWCDRGAAPEVPVQDVTVGGTSVVNASGVAEVPAIPTVPTISTDIDADATSDAKTTSPKAVKTFVEGKGYLGQSDTVAAGTLDVDSTPTANSNNLVTSGGVKSYVDGAIPSVPVTDVTVGGTSVVSSGTAAIPAMPTLATGMSAIKIWAGTQAEYDLLTPASDTLYFIKES